MIKAEFFSLNRELLIQGKRMCWTCNSIKLLDAFHRDRNRYKSSCKSCRNELSLKKNKRSFLIMKQKSLLKDGLRLCNTCHEIKPLNFFKVNWQSKQYRDRCRDCSKIYFKQNRLKRKHLLKLEIDNVKRKRDSVTTWN